jgi:hypothetical protein
MMRLITASARQRGLIFTTFLLCLVSWGTFASGHSEDVILARVIRGHDSEISVSLTADASKNPHLRESKNLAESLGNALEVHLPSGKRWLVGEMGRASVSLSNRFEHLAPIPVSHEITGVPSELLTAKWTWRPSESPLRFKVPASNPNTVLLWSITSESEEPLPGWRLMIAGDQSDPIHLSAEPRPLRWDWRAKTATGIAASGLLLNLMVFIYKTKRRQLS